MNKINNSWSFLRSLLLIIVVTTGIAGILGSFGSGGGSSNASNENDGGGDGGTVDASSSPYFSMLFPTGLPEIAFFQIGDSDFQQILPEDFELEDTGVSASSVKTAKVEYKFSGHVARVIRFADDSGEPLNGGRVDFEAEQSANRNTRFTIGAVGLMDGQRYGTIWKGTIGDAVDARKVQYTFGRSLDDQRFSISGSASPNILELFGSAGRVGNPQPILVQEEKDYNFTFSPFNRGEENNLDYLLRAHFSSGSYFYTRRKQDIAAPPRINVLPILENRAENLWLSYAGLDHGSQLNKTLDVSFMTAGAGGVTAPIAQNVEVPAGENTEVAVPVPPSIQRQDSDRFTVSLRSRTLQTDGVTADRRNDWIIPEFEIPPRLEILETTPEDRISATLGDVSEFTASVRWEIPPVATPGESLQYVGMHTESDEIAGLDIFITRNRIALAGAELSPFVGFPSAISMLPNWPDTWTPGVNNIRNTSAAFSNKGLVETFSYFKFGQPPTDEDKTEFSETVLIFPRVSVDPN